jgi:hypothetical protein
MLPNHHGKLAEALRQGLRLNKARADCFASAAMAVVQAQSVRLADIAAHLPGEARGDSKFRRLQNFFLRLRPDYELVARFILGLLGAVLGQKPLVIAMDRTNWEARDNNVNLLVLSVCLGDAGQPLLWTDLRHPGNSNTKKRIRLTRRLLRVLDVPRIQCLVGDREFVGEDWFSWLLERRIPFVMRLRENMKITPKDDRTSDARAHFAALRPGDWLDLGMCHVCGVDMGVCGVRTSKDELLILGYSGVSASDAKLFYLRRWNIETGFEKLKTHGFHLESSRLRGGGKYERLMAVLAVGFAWCYAMGDWSVSNGHPIRVIRRLGRRAQSIFRRGRELLASMFLGTCRQLRQTLEKAFGILRDAQFTPS